MGDSCTRNDEDAEMGNHYHRECRAFLYLIKGRARVVIRHLVDNSMDEIIGDGGVGIYFLPFETHIVKYLDDTEFILLKSYRYSDSNPDIIPCAVER